MKHNLRNLYLIVGIVAVLFSIIMIAYKDIERNFKFMIVVTIIGLAGLLLVSKALKKPRVSIEIQVKKKMLEEYQKRKTET